MLNELSKEINKDVREKGFWNDMDSSISFLDGEIKKATKDAFISQKISLVHTEISEMTEAMRKENYEAEGHGLYKKDSFVDEIADSIIRLLDIVGELDIDIDSQIKWKLEKNKQREFKFNKQF